MQGADHVRLLRASDAGEQRVTPLELFFDLVYVFAVTQLSHLLLERPTFGGAMETLFLLLVVWWAWMYTTWFTNLFDPGTLPVRLLLAALMLASLLMAVAIPEAFGERSEEHTSELQSRQYLVCRLLLEKKKTNKHQTKLLICIPHIQCVD